MQETSWEFVTCHANDPEVLSIMLLSLVSLLRNSHPHRFNLLLVACISVVALCASLFGQNRLPYADSGRDSAFAQLDFAEMYLNQQAWESAERENGTTINPKSMGSGLVSALDLAAPKKAVRQFSRAAYYLRSQNPKEAIHCLQDAIHIYPKFVSAHLALGFAFFDQHDPRAKDEFQAAASLDSSYPASFLNLGILQLQSNDFTSAELNLQKAASLNQSDPRVLAALAFAQKGDHKYAACLRTVQKLHRLPHKKLADVHYIAAAAAQAMHDSNIMREQLTTYLAEDPTGPLAPIVRKHLAQMANADARSQRKSQLSPSRPSPVIATSYMSFPNTPRLENELNAVNLTPDDALSDDSQPDANSPASPVDNPPRAPSSFATWDSMFTIHQAVDETALFFSVSDHGHTVPNLSLADIQVRDNHRPPEKVLEFIPQAKLPLRLGLLIDTSDSVGRRFDFEKTAAEKFMRKVLNATSDLAFVAGFNTNVNVTQDFTNNASLLTQGVDRLRSAGETSVFDAVYYGCWKLAAYPDAGRVAKVLVVLTDGEDNSSHHSLMQAIEEAEATGVTVYTLSTAVKTNVETDADQVVTVLGERSGGQAIFPKDLKDLDQDLARLPETIRSRYLIAYKAADFSPDGKYRTIQLKAVKNGKRLRVQTRKGYYARLALPDTESH